MHQIRLGSKLANNFELGPQFERNKQTEGKRKKDTGMKGHEQESRQKKERCD